MNLLIQESPLIILPSLVKAIGANEAIVLQQIHYWIETNKNAKRNFQDGRYWAYNTYEGWQKEIFWLSESTVRRILAQLVKRGLLIKGNYNKSKFDRTNWYTIDYDAFDEMCASVHGEQVETVSEDKPIPENNLTETNNKNIKGRFPKKTTEGFISSLVEDYGEDRVTAMIDAVNSYIDDWYVDETCRNHPQEGKYKRAVFAKKLLECADKTGIDDETVVAGLYYALIKRPDDVDPQIYYATSDKPLGNGILATNEIDYCQIAGTDYDINT